MCSCLYLVHKSQNDKNSTYEVLPRQRRYENSSDEFDIGYCPIRVEVTASVLNSRFINNVMLKRSYFKIQSEGSISEVRKIKLSMPTYVHLLTKHNNNATLELYVFCNNYVEKDIIIRVGGVYFSV